MLSGPVSRRRRRCPRFSMRAMIVFVLMIGAAMGWVVRSAGIQGEAVALIVRAGGRVEYAWEERSDGRCMPGEKPWAPRWLVDLIGVDFFSHVTAVELPLATDAAIVEVGSLTQLQRLSLSGSSPIDAGLAHLEGLTKLSFLDLGGTRVTGDGLAHFCIESPTHFRVFLRFPWFKVDRGSDSRRSR